MPSSALPDPEIAGTATPFARPDVSDCVVIGSGPAGLTAGLYLRRFHRQVRIVDAGGGRARRILRSNNVAGFPEGVSGPELLQRMERQLQQSGGQVIQGTVLSVERAEGGQFVVNVGAEAWLARTVMLCTGVKDRLPSIPGAAAVDAAGRMRYCPICDGYEHTGQRIGVLGNSVHAVREAAFLQRYSTDIWFIGVADMGDEAREAVRSAQLPSVPGRPLRLALGHRGDVIVATDDGGDYRFDVLYAAFGVDPCTSLAARLGARLDDKGNIVTDAHGLTSVDNLYAAGDVVRALDQIGVAVGQAAIAATAIHNRL